MAFKMNGFSGFKKMDEKTAKQKYEEALEAGKVKPDTFNNFMYKLTGDIKYKIKE